MRISTRSRYGARAMAELAAASPGRPISVKELAENQKLSTKYLEQIMAILKAAGLVRPVRGLHGGYTLTASPGRISLNDVVGALESGPALAECVADPDSCPMRANCPTHDTWVELKEAMTKVLERTTLQDLAERLKKMDNVAAPMYYI